MAAPQSKEQQQAIKATLKAIEQDYKNKVREAEKKCANVRKEAEKVAERERAEIKAKKDKADKVAKDEFQVVKHEAGEVHIKLVMDLIKNVILDIKSRNLDLVPGYYGDNKNGVNGSSMIGRSNSTMSSASAASSTSTSGAAKEDAEIKEWVEYAAERLEVHMSKGQARQRLLEEVATGALIRQHHAQQEAMRKTEELQRQLQQLQLLHQQQLQGEAGGAALSQGHDQGQGLPPPAYASTFGPAGINGSDYSITKDEKQSTT